MQIPLKDFDKHQHEIFRALVVRQPAADQMTRVVMQNEDGGYEAALTIYVANRDTPYRGDVLVCSAAKPILRAFPASVMCGLVELYDTKPICALTEKEWAFTGYAPEERKGLAEKYAWLFRNPRRVVEMPVDGKRGFYDIAVPKGDVTQYPQEIKLDTDGWKIIREHITRKVDVYGKRILEETPNSL